jgi:hypothetical protein
VEWAVTKTGSNALKQAARTLAAAEGIGYTAALRRLTAQGGEISREHNDRPCPPDCPTKDTVLANEGGPWEGTWCPVHQPDAVAGWGLGDACPRARWEFLTNGGLNGPLFRDEYRWTGDCRTDAPELAAFCDRLSRVGQAEFARTWKLAYDAEVDGIEIILQLRQANEIQLSQMVLAAEREAIREELKGALGGGDYGFTEIDLKFADPVATDHTEEIDHLIDVIETATAHLAILLNHQGLTTESMEQGRFAELLAQDSPATAQDVFRAAGWQLPTVSDDGGE